jgi:hypothetical protein
MLHPADLLRLTTDAVWGPVSTATEAVNTSNLLYKILCIECVGCVDLVAADPYGFDRRGSFHAPRSGDDKRSRQDRLADEWYGDDGSDSYGSDRGDRKYYDHNAVDDYGKQKQGQQRGEKQKHQEDLEKYGEKRNDEWYYDLVPPVHASVKDCKCKPG